MLRMQFLSPIQLSRLVIFLPQFVRLFYRLITDARVPMLAKMVPWMGLLLMVTPPALELDMIPIVGELDWILIGYLSLKVFIWLCPPDVVREHVSQIGRGE
ncbi:MAG: hypothetical protein WA993_07510 [Candidatus Binatus sp.]|jgi:hypothetical protein|uniref:hypothetical protein n=1 Tax=Candidatus Binatus sp. TaxID=2811406 RepID=UPI003C9A09B2